MSQSLYARLARKFAPERFSPARREMLKASVAASAGLLLSNCASYKNAMGRGSKFVNRTVIVVGAGYAGLACAYELMAAGYTVQVVEARSRVGGRVVTFSDMPEGRLVEGGGELIGDNHPMWAAYAKKFGLTFREIPDEPADAQKPLVIGGKRLDNEAAEKIFKEMDTVLGKLNDAARGIDADKPWTTENAATLDAFTMARWLEEVHASELCKVAIRAEWEGNNGVAFGVQSYLAFLTMIKGGGLENFWTASETKRCAQGNQALAEAFAKGLTGFLQGSRLRLRAPVAGISWGPSGARVTLASSETLAADDLVLAVPPSVWPGIKFTPALPPELGIQMGVAVKQLSAVKGRFWEAKKLSAEANTDGDLSMTWEGTAGYPDGPAELTAFSGGPAAERVRLRSPADRAAFYRQTLEGLYPGYGDAVGATRFMDWPSDKWTQACYSFGAPGQITTAGPMIYNGLERMHFAGEHTCFKFCGYMEGALNSGAAVARRIAARDGVV